MWVQNKYCGIRQATGTWCDGCVCICGCGGCMSVCASDTHWCLLTRHLKKNTVALAAACIHAQVVNQLCASSPQRTNPQLLCPEKLYMSEGPAGEERIERGLKNWFHLACEVSAVAAGHCGYCAGSVQLLWAVTDRPLCPGRGGQGGRGGTPQGPVRPGFHAEWLSPASFSPDTDSLSPALALIHRSGGNKSLAAFPSFDVPYRPTEVSKECLTKEANYECFPLYLSGCLKGEFTMYLKERRKVERYINRWQANRLSL